MEAAIAAFDAAAAATNASAAAAVSAVTAVGAEADRRGRGKQCNNSLEGWTESFLVCLGVLILLAWLYGPVAWYLQSTVVH